jgi:hypothetical protein
MKNNTLPLATAPVDITRRAQRARQLIAQAQELMASIDPAAVSATAALVLVELGSALEVASVTATGFIDEMPQKRSWNRRPAAEATTLDQGEEPSFIEI